jgi:hypothetical protein
MIETIAPAFISVHYACVSKDAALTIRIPGDLKRRLVAKARKERRSLSSQVEIELERALTHEPSIPRRGSKLLGRYAGGRVPTDDDFQVVRRLLWGNLPRRHRARRG